VDLLDACRRRNPSLVAAAAALHRQGAIPPDTYVVDLETVGENAALLVRATTEHRLLTYYEAKQFGRNPLVCDTLEATGFDVALAIDVEEAIALNDQGRKVGHVGHLGQPATADIPWALAELEPEVITVYSLELAAVLAKHAAAAGRTQDVLLKVLGRGDIHSDLIGGGTPEEALVETARSIEALGSLRVVGVTTYPVLRWDVRENRFAPTPNLLTLLRARDALVDAGFEVTQVNAGGNACVETMSELASRGVTHVEPGQAFVGATPGHFFSDMPERPAVVWVSEIAYADGDHAYAFASGMVCNASLGNIWNAIRYDRILALVGSDPTAIAERAFWAHPQSYAYSDPSAFMYARIEQALEHRAQVGDTVVCGFRTQI
jgi:predicted amino acid racemase